MNYPISHLNSMEKEALVDYIETYAGREGTGVNMTAPIDYVLRFWNENKSTLFEMFEESLTLTKTVEFKQSIYDRDVQDQLRKLNRTAFVSAYNKLYSRFYAYATHSIGSTRPVCDWKGDIIEPPPYMERYTKDSLLNVADGLSSLVFDRFLFSNIYRGISFVIYYGDGEKDFYKIESGCKVSRALGKLAHFFHLPDFERFRVDHSMILNQKSLKGELCLSIHPLDYLTMSDNSLNWDSCMNWTQGGGDYRQGTVEMMNSPYVVVAYLKSSTPFDCPTKNGHIQWTNKKWRCLYIVHPDVIASIKQYPYENADLDNYCMNALRELATPFYGTYESDLTHINLNSGEGECGNGYIRFVTGYMYNDMYDERHMYLNTNINIETNSTLDIEYSGPSECMVCGQSGNNFDSELVVCFSCDDFARCDYCEEYFDQNELTYVDGTALCPECLQEHTITCDCCGKVKITDYPSHVTLFYHNPDVDDDDDYNNEYIASMDVCDECLELFYAPYELDSYDYDEYGVDAAHVPLQVIKDIWKIDRDNTSYALVKNVRKNYLEKNNFHLDPELEN